MGILAELEALYAGIEELLPLIDALPLTGELAIIRTKVELVLSKLKIVL